MYLFHNRVSLQISSEGVCINRKYGPRVFKALLLFLRSILHLGDLERMSNVQSSSSKPSRYRLLMVRLPAEKTKNAGQFSITAPICMSVGNGT